ncbi:TPA: hypothetical protein ACH3X1_008493 [Trebouxia sp. C0004]
MGFVVKNFTAQLCYKKWGYEWLRANSEQLEALRPDIATDLQTVIASIMDERKNKQAAVPGCLSLPAEDEPRLKPRVREICNRDPRTNKPIELLGDLQDSALAMTAYDDSSASGAGAHNDVPATKKFKWDNGAQGSAHSQASGQTHRTAVAQPFRPTTPLLHKAHNNNNMTVQPTVTAAAQRLLVGIKTGEEPGRYAMQAYIRGAAHGSQAPIPPAIACPKADRVLSTCWVAGCDGINQDGKTRHNNWQSCHLAQAHFRRIVKGQ